MLCTRGRKAGRPLSSRDCSSKVKSVSGYEDRVKTTLVTRIKDCFFGKKLKRWAEYVFNLLKYINIYSLKGKKRNR